MTTSCQGPGPHLLYTDPAIFEREMDKMSLIPGCGLPTPARFPKPAATRHLRGLSARGGGARPRKQQVRNAAPTAAATAPPPCAKATGQDQRLRVPPTGWATPWTAPCAAMPNPESYGDLLTTRPPTSRSSSCASKGYAGMIFATFKGRHRALVDYLGPAKEWMDLFMKRGGFR